MLVEVGVLCVVLACDPEKCSAGESLVSLDSNTDAVVLTADWSKHPTVLHSADLETVLAKDFGSLKDVHSVLVERAESNFLVWISVENPTKESRERVFAKELGLIDGFPEIDFDFNIISARGRTPSEFASSAKVIYSREG